MFDKTKIKLTDYNEMHLNEICKKTKLKPDAVINILIERSYKAIMEQKDYDGDIILLFNKLYETPPPPDPVFKYIASETLEIEIDPNSFEISENQFYRTAEAIRAKLKPDLKGTGLVNQFTDGLYIYSKVRYL